MVYVELKMSVAVLFEVIFTLKKFAWKVNMDLNYACKLLGLGITDLDYACRLLGLGITDLDS